MRLTTVTIQHHPGAIILESLVFFWGTPGSSVETGYRHHHPIIWTLQ
jgi:hypothetical protein